MDPKDRLAYELAMIQLQDARDECLRWLEDEPAAVAPRRVSHWWSLGRWQ